MNDATEEQMQTDALHGIRDELEELNSHLVAYLKCMALNLLTPCNPNDADAAQKARDGAALELLSHVEKTREAR